MEFFATPGINLPSFLKQVILLNVRLRKIRFLRMIKNQRATSSVVERVTDNDEVEGSIPSSPTTRFLLESFDKKTTSDGGRATSYSFGLSAGVGA